MPASDVDHRLDRLEQGLASLIDMVCRNLFGDQRSDISPGIALLADQLLELATELREEHNEQPSLLCAGHDSPSDDGRFYRSRGCRG